MDTEPLKTLDQLAIEHQTDRASVFTRTWGKPHDYARHYDKLFTPLRDQPVKLLEIGVGGGEGIRMRLEYFPNAKVFGVDNQHDTNPWDTVGAKTHPRYTFSNGDQCDPDFWNVFIRLLGGDFGIIVDDGLHSNISVITTFNALWQHVKPGGFYAIEDLNTAYGGPSFFVSPNWPNQVEFLKGKIDELNKGGGIDSIYFAKEICILKKAL
jgi:hypothetical protein